MYSYTDGDEPGVAMNLYRFLDGIGYRPVLMGQLKGFLDRYRNPDTQRELAERLGQNPAVLACFADGSKLALEAAIMGNATGFVPSQPRSGPSRVSMTPAGRWVPTAASCTTASRNESNSSTCCAYSCFWIEKLAQWVSS